MLPDSVKSGCEAGCCWQLLDRAHCSLVKSEVRISFCCENFIPILPSTLGRRDIGALCPRCPDLELHISSKVISLYPIAGVVELPVNQVCVDTREQTLTQTKTHLIEHNRYKSCDKEIDGGSSSTTLNSLRSL